MPTDMPVTSIAGVDGCRAGWIAVFASAGGGAAADCLVFAKGRFRAITEHKLRPAVVAVDVPIGLPERTEQGGRGPEIALRPLLGARQSSVFAIPSRAAVYARDYGEACREALATSAPCRKVSRQAFGLFERIREVDALLREEPALRAVVHECHPEGSFRMMKGAPLDEPKKVKSRVHPAGMAERRSLLIEAGFPAEFLDRAPPPGADRDDLFDACAAVWTARRILRGEARAFPDAFRHDPYGLPVVIRA
jgi:predicted RNase H-like nuclease